MHKTVRNLREALLECWCERLVAHDGSNLRHCCFFHLPGPPPKMGCPNGTPGVCLGLLIGPGMGAVRLAIIVFYLEKAKILKKIQYKTQLVENYDHVLLTARVSFENYDAIHSNFIPQIRVVKLGFFFAWRGLQGSTNCPPGTNLTQHRWISRDDRTQLTTQVDLHETNILEDFWEGRD